MIATHQQQLFIVAGMPRTATTFLYQRFQEHPHIFCPYRKETNFFCVNYHRGFQWYRGLYADMPNGYVAADVSPAYFLDGSAVDRMKALGKDLRVILGLREPSSWSLSWYTQVMSSLGGTKPSLEKFLTGYSLQIGGGHIWQDFRDGFVRRMIKQYREAFGDRLLIYCYDELNSDPLGVLNSIEHFIGVPKHFTSDNFRNEIVNAGTRRNIGLIANLLSREAFVDVIGRLVPRSFVQVARNAYVGIGTSKTPPPPPSFTPEERELVARMFAEDDQWVSDLFVTSPIQLGASGPFRLLDA